MHTAFTEYRNPEAISLSADVCTRALDARDARFDGLFFVGITSTRVYCRPVCPARVAYPSHRRFFDTAAAAECAGFRPCLRCRPELAPGRAMIDAVSRLARSAAHRIEAGALNGRSVADLARELGVSDRHLRRAIERELGVSPIELAQTHRLLLAKRLLADTRLSVTRIAYASGFQSLRRFNSVFRERYRMPPSVLRRTQAGARRTPTGDGEEDLVRLTLAYRAPFAWDALLTLLAHDAIPGVELVEGRRYGRTVRIDGARGVIFAEDAARLTRGRRRRTIPDGDHRGRPSTATNGRGMDAHRQTHLDVDVSPSLLPALMPLLAQLRQLFDLDAEPAAVDAHLSQDGLEPLVRRRPGLRIPGAMDSFEIALQGLLRGDHTNGTAGRLMRRIVHELGEPFDSGVPALDRLAPTAEQIAQAGASRLAALGVARRRAESITSLARSISDRTLHMHPGCDVDATLGALLDVDGVDVGLATTIVMRALAWPDAFPASDPMLQRAAGASSTHDLLARAERWRPWRSYAAVHLRLHARER